MDAPGEKPSTDDALAKLRAAHEARKARRAPRGRPPIEQNAPVEEEKPAAAESAADADKAELEKLRAELSTAQVEMASMRRNHVANVQKLSAERDMFAQQLAQEQAAAPPESVRGIEDLRAQLKASRMRNANLEEENVQLRQERKELALRVTASKTIDAASTGYEKVVVDLIDVKLKCATLNDEKEMVVRENRNLKADNEALSEANRLLEKSRAEWVLKCAEIERNLRAELEAAQKNKANLETSPPPKVSMAELTKGQKSLSQNSDLQELAL